MTDTSLLARPVIVAAIPSDGIDEAIVATAAERAAIAAAYGLLEVAALAADLKVERPAADVILVRGRVKASIVQSCVVSLVPVAQEIDEPVDMRFIEAGSDRAPAPARPGAEVMIAPESADPPDTWSGPTIDLGAVVLEHFALAIDPYPRAPGAVLDAVAGEDGETAAASPFAALARLAAKKQ